MAFVPPFPSCRKDPLPTKKRCRTSRGGRRGEPIVAAQVSKSSSPEDQKKESEGDDGIFGWALGALSIFPFRQEKKDSADSGFGGQKRKDCATPEGFPGDTEMTHGVDERTTSAVPSSVVTPLVPEKGQEETRKEIVSRMFGDLDPRVTLQANRRGNRNDWNSLDDDDDDDGLEARRMARKSRVRTISTAMTDVNRRSFGSLHESYVHEVLLEAHERRVKAGQSSVDLETIIPYDLQKELFNQLERVAPTVAEEEADNDAVLRAKVNKGTTEKGKTRSNDVKQGRSILVGEPEKQMPGKGKESASGPWWMAPLNIISNAFSSENVQGTEVSRQAKTVIPVKETVEKEKPVEVDMERDFQQLIQRAARVHDVETSRDFIERVGVRSLVMAARMTSGLDRASALTALSTIASLMPSSRQDILEVDGRSILNTMMESLGTHPSLVDAFFGRVEIERGFETQAKISSAHLLGSLALAKGKSGKARRDRLARNTRLVDCLVRLTGGATKGETEGAARAARRALAVLGVNQWYPKVPGQRGLRVLSIDGGGTRALMTFEMLKHLKRITGCEVHEMFDIIGGTSTGAIIAGALAVMKKPIEDVEALYNELIYKVFAKNPLNSSKMIFTRAYYDTSVFEELLKRECGMVRLLDSAMDAGCPKFFAVSAVLTPQRTVLTHVFRNYSYPVDGNESRYYGTEDVPLWVAMRCSSAAPTFFSEMRLNGEVHADGAIVANNPAAVALHEARAIYPNVPVEVLVSCGNGVLHNTDVESISKQRDKNPSIGWSELLGSIISSATSTEQAHHTLEDLMPAEKYYRFNPPTFCTDIDETDPSKLAFWLREARTYVEQEGPRFERLAKILRPRRQRGPLGNIRGKINDEVEYLQFGTDSTVY